MWFMLLLSFSTVCLRCRQTICNSYTRTHTRMHTSIYTGVEFPSFGAFEYAMMQQHTQRTTTMLLTRVLTALATRRCRQQHRQQLLGRYHLSTGQTGSQHQHHHRLSAGRSRLSDTNTSVVAVQRKRRTADCCCCCCCRATATPVRCPDRTFWHFSRRTDGRRRSWRRRGLTG